jgi:hypothetical protein
VAVTDLDVLSALAAAAPLFRPDWDDVDPLAYVDVGDLVYYLQSDLLAGRTAEVTTVFNAAEDLVRLGDPGVANFIQVGFFECIQNTSPGSRVDQEAFEPFVSARSRMLWNGLNAMWGGSTTNGG